MGLAPPPGRKLGRGSEAANTRSIATQHRSLKQQKHRDFSRPAQAKEAMMKSNVLDPKPSGVTKPHATGSELKSRRETTKISAVTKNDHGQDHAKDGNKSAMKGNSAKRVRDASRMDPPAKKPKVQEHSLSLAFKEATTAYRNVLAAELPAQLAETTTMLSNQLAAAHDTDVTNLHALDAQLAALTKPLADTRLELVLKRGTPQEQITTLRLGDRMAQFSARVREKGAKLARLLDEWDNVAEEIEELKRGVLGEPLLSTSAGNDAVESEKKGEDDAVDVGYAAEVKKLRAEYVQQQEEAERAFASECAELVKKMQESENAYEQHAEKQRRQLLAFAKDQLREMGEDEDGDDDEEYYDVEDEVEE